MRKNVGVTYSTTLWSSNKHIKNPSLSKTTSLFVKEMNGKAFGLYSSENRIYLHTPWKLYPLKLHPNYKYAHIYSASCQRD